MPFILEVLVSWHYKIICPTTGNLPCVVFFSKLYSNLNFIWELVLILVSTYNSPKVLKKVEYIVLSLGTLEPNCKFWLYIDALKKPWGSANTLGFLKKRKVYCSRYWYDKRYDLPLKCGINRFLCSCKNIRWVWESL